MEDLAALQPDWLTVSRETMQRLEALSKRVQDWNLAVNLVSKASVAQIWTRHILDSAQLYLMATKNVRRWVDLGSGGGFPGLVVAIMAMESQPEMELVLVESDVRKAVFLREAIRTLGLNSQVIAARIDEIAPLNADVLSARALAPLHVLCGFAAHHLAPEGLALFPKGATYASELDQARKSWVFTADHIPSKTEPSTVVLAISGLRHV
jgi:16S rRNA (guanine527-N7)-methyltransferase